MEKFSFGVEAPEEKDEKKISRRDFLKKVATVVAAVAGAGVVKKVSGFIDIPSEEELKKKGDEERAKRIKNIQGEPDVVGTHLDNRYEGYINLESFLKDYPHVEAQPEELEKAQRYFKEN